MTYFISKHDIFETINSIETEKELSIDKLNNT